MIFNSADILIPKNTDLKKWSVVACDQYTSEPDYWNEVKANVGDSPSALNIIYPEAFLSEGDGRIAVINKNIDEYISSGVFEEYKNSLVFVERLQRNGKARYGIIGTVDLEHYDYNKGSESLIRATEGTVLERIPPRVKIRENAALEMPHILMLIDDDKRTVIEPLKEKADSFEKLYDFDLQMNSGHLKGYLIDSDTTKSVLSAIEKLGERETFVGKYKTDKATLQFAVGDGNHSLATAKACWENLKGSLSDAEKAVHPARFALVELMNVHDDTLEFEAIHRVVTDVDADKLLNDLFKYYPGASYENNGGQVFTVCLGGEKKKVYITDAPSQLAVGTLGKFLDEYLENNRGEVDYIHGEDVVEKLSDAENSIGFILPSMEKSELFETVIHDGALPRKTFSMGEAHDKKFYLECKKIK